MVLKVLVATGINMMRVIFAEILAAVFCVYFASVQVNCVWYYRQ